MKFPSGIMMENKASNYVLIMQNGPEMVDVEHGSLDCCRNKLSEIAGRTVEVENITLGDSNYFIIPEYDFELLVKTGRSKRLD